MKLVKINLELEKAYYDFINEWDVQGEEIIPFAARLLDRTFESFIADTEQIETIAPEGFVTASTYFLVDENEIVGAINIRHELNEHLINFGGHIGYGVRPSKRGKGYAKSMLQLVVPYLEKLALQKVLITCIATNIASAKTITNCGGVLENQIVDQEGKTINRYWVDVEELGVMTAIRTSLEALGEEYHCHKRLKGGTASRIVLINEEFVLKMNTPEQLRNEWKFLEFTDNPIFSKVLYVDKKYIHMIYRFIEGELPENIEDKEGLLKTIYEISHGYKGYAYEGYGYLDELQESWEEFLLNEIEYSSRYLKELSIDKESLIAAVRCLRDYPFRKRLLHGDFGLHNFIYKNNRLVGIIDPQGLVGDPLYELLFAVASNLEFLGWSSLEKIAEMADEPMEKVKCMMKIVLYCRIARSVKYEEARVEEYLRIYKRL